MMKAIKTNGAPAAIGAYSQAIEANGFVFVSGQLGLDPLSGILKEGIAEQTKQALSNASAILQAAGLGLDDVVKTTIFISDIALFGEMNEAYQSFFAEPFPARSAVSAKALPKNALVEIECIAARNSSFS